ncbi:hypothetical protein [Pontimicrobium aquaticum]|uniref:Uncharacterized protein n=1 Tax=Pontimicrobium aquaticum TaxID=2565367 RepID=A0A4U0EJH8_9FLAO|nr:hypothetical protein [Pontimicrobium aquaticum]TJY31607.1 hypothetical protein E5167_15140 [Pontimicrobium aquaticum]
MDEKIVIKYVDELVNDFIKDPFQDFTTNEFLDFSKIFRTESMKKSERLDLADEIEIFGIKKKLFKVSQGHILLLDEKGIELKDFKKGYVKFEKSLKKTPLTLYQKIYLSFFIPLSILALSNRFFPPVSKSDFQELSRDFDSLNLKFDYMKKQVDILSKLNEHDTLQPKNYPDSDN